MLGLVTFGIYDIVCLYTLTEDINIIASRYDGKKTMNFLLMYFIIAPITFGIGSLVWFHNLCTRIGDELRRRNIDYKFGASTFWVCNVLLPVATMFIFCAMATFFGIPTQSYTYTSTLSDFSAVMVIMYVMLILSYIGPFVYLHKLLKSMNLLSESYNMYG